MADVFEASFQQCFDFVWFFHDSYGEGIVNILKERVFNVDVDFCVSHSDLLVHHIDGNKRNQAPENLVTVCTSCHRRLHPRGRILTVEEAKKKMKKES